ncbi:MAG: hypothetical protein R3E93_10530 [Thiothrix sp.]
MLARGWLVSSNSAFRFNTLVTIATPNVGTPAADMACLANDTPMALSAGMFMGLAGRTDDAEDLYEDMRTEKAGQPLLAEPPATSGHPLCVDCTQAADAPGQIRFCGT